MAIVIEANYSKKLGLPGYSSHSYSVSLKSELSDLSQVERESAKLYAILQGSVDREIQETGFIPDSSVPTPEPSKTRTSNSKSTSENWNCSDRQRGLILKIVEEHQLDKQEVESLANERFDLPVKSLNKLQASGLIDELIQKYGPKRNHSQRNGHQRPYRNGVSR